MAVDLTDDKIEMVRRQISHCLGSLGGGSRHLAAYTIASGTFRIARIEDMGQGKIKYSFKADAHYESEFMVYEEDGGDIDDLFPGSHAEHIEGYIVLDEDYNLGRDENGKVMFGPWHYVDPSDF
ncbi:hypothetical protein ACFLVP_04565 [Chloroflexota bacterium]